MKLKHCNHRGCRVLVPQGQRYCDKHVAEHQYTSRPAVVTTTENREYNQRRRNQEANQFYHSRQWTVLRQWVVRRDMYTDQVTKQVVTDNTLIVDHIVPLRLCKPGDRLDPRNLWSLSRGTHNVKTKIEQSMTDVQLEHASREWWCKVLRPKADADV